MTRPRYAPVPRGYARVWVLANVDDPNVRPWLFSAYRDAKNAACLRDVITPLDIPAGAVPGLGTTAATKKARKR